MADEPISALTLFTSYSTADEVEILDVSDTTFASTGTNKRIQFSTLLSMAGVGASASTGTVTSVSFTGDGTVLSSTPSAAVTTSGTVPATLKTQTPNLVLAGPATGSTAAAPTFRALAMADLPASMALGTGTNPGGNSFYCSPLVSSQVAMVLQALSSQSTSLFRKSLTKTESSNLTGTAPPASAPASSNQIK